MDIAGHLAELLLEKKRCGFRILVLKTHRRSGEKKQYIFGTCSAIAYNIVSMKVIKSVAKVKFCNHKIRRHIIDKLSGCMHSCFTAFR